MVFDVNDIPLEYNYILRQLNRLNYDFNFNIQNRLRTSNYLYLVNNI